VRQMVAASEDGRNGCGRLGGRWLQQLKIVEIVADGCEEDGCNI
jgi:hypothetical protein